MDWLAVDNKLILSLTNISARTALPVSFIVGNAFDLSLDTFIRVSKIDEYMLQFTKIFEIREVKIEKKKIYFQFVKVTYASYLQHAPRGNKEIKFISRWALLDFAPVDLYSYKY